MEEESKTAEEEMTYTLEIIAHLNTLIRGNITCRDGRMSIPANPDNASYLMDFYKTLGEALCAVTSRSNYFSGQFSKALLPTLKNEVCLLQGDLEVYEETNKDMLK